jgi:hypothetical protein
MLIMLSVTIGASPVAIDSLYTRISLYYIPNTSINTAMEVFRMYYNKILVYSESILAFLVWLEELTGDVPLLDLACCLITQQRRHEDNEGRGNRSSPPSGAYGLG